MAQNIYPAFHIEDHVLGLNLENNSLQSLEDVQLPPNLLQLYLANNKLRGLPDSLLDHQVTLKSVSLSGNPWNCDCSALKFKKWITANHASVRFNSYKGAYLSLVLDVFICVLPSSNAYCCQLSTFHFLLILCMRYRRLVDNQIIQNYFG